MGLGGILLIGLVLAALVIGLFTMLMNPRDIDEEEEAVVEKEAQAADTKRRWWQRR